MSVGILCANFDPFFPEKFFDKEIALFPVHVLQRLKDRCPGLFSRWLTRVLDRRGLGVLMRVQAAAWSGDEETHNVLICR